MWKVKSLKSTIAAFWETKFHIGSTGGNKVKMWQNFKFFSFLRDFDAIFKFFHKYKFFHRKNCKFLYFMWFSMKFLPKPSIKLGKLWILVSEIDSLLFKGLGRNFMENHKNVNNCNLNLEKLIFYKYLSKLHHKPS